MAEYGGCANWFQPPERFCMFSFNFGGTPATVADDTTAEEASSIKPASELRVDWACAVRFRIFVQFRRTELAEK